MRRIAVMGIILVIEVAVLAQTINLSGTVKDDKGAAIAGAAVFLVSNPSMKDSTDASGAFTISSNTPVRGGGASGILVKNDYRIRIKGNHLFFSIGSPTQTGDLSIFSSNGVRCALIRLGKLEPGVHSRTLPDVAPGFYVLRVAIDHSVSILNMVATRDGFFANTRNAGIKGASGLSRSAAVAVDTIVANKAGFTTVKTGITSYEQKDIPIIMQSGSTLPPITDYSSKGPFATKSETTSGYTIYRPDPLGQNGFLHAPIVFGPGIGQAASTHATMLTNFASHGFVVVGTPVLNGGPGDANNLKTMQAALDWIVKQNTTAGSIYQGKLWADHCVSMGYSVGGTSAVQMGAAAAVFTVVSIHGHTAEAALHGPMLQTTGTKDNVGLPLQQATYDKSKVQTFLATLTNADHGYINSNGGGEERKAIVAWMRYWIYNDTGAKNFFWGNDCVLCKAPWENPQRKNWQ
jgi:dienelactone hydrolase